MTEFILAAEYVADTVGLIIHLIQNSNFVVVNS